MNLVVRLVPPEEPCELRLRLREDAFDRAAFDRAAFDRAAFAGGADESSSGSDALAEWLWERWKGDLVPAGMDREGFAWAIGGYRREIWFWLMGDRGWDQLMNGLTGRVTRRASAGPTGS